MSTNIQEWHDTTKKIEYIYTRTMEFIDENEQLFANSFITIAGGFAFYKSYYDTFADTFNIFSFLGTADVDLKIILHKDYHNKMIVVLSGILSNFISHLTEHNIITAYDCHFDLDTNNKYQYPLGCLTDGLDIIMYKYGEEYSVLNAFFGYKYGRDYDYDHILHYMNLNGKYKFIDSDFTAFNIIYMYCFTRSYINAGIYNNRLLKISQIVGRYVIVTYTGDKSLYKNLEYLDKIHFTLKQLTLDTKVHFAKTIMEYLNSVLYHSGDYLGEIDNNINHPLHKEIRFCYEYITDVVMPHAISSH